MKKWKGIVTAVGAVFVSICFLTVNSALAKSEPYKIGAIFDISGPASALGIPEKRTVEMVVEQVNKAGGINGRPLELVFYDTALDVQKTINSVNKLIKKDKVLAIIGPSTSGVSMALIETMQNNEMPNISCAARIDIIDPPKKWVFKTPQTDKQAVEKILTYAKKKGIKKVALMIAEGGFGAGGLKQLNNLTPKYGIKIVASEKFSEKDPDVSTQLTKIRGTDAQAMIVWDTDKGSARVARNMRQLGMKMPVYMSHGIANKKFIAQAKEAAEGVIFPAGRLVVLEYLPESDPQKKILAKYAADFKAKYNTAPDTFGGHAWDALHLAVAALEAVGCDRTKIRDYLESKKGFVGQHGVFNFSPTDHNGLVWQDAFNMIQVKNGDWSMAD